MKMDGPPRCRMSRTPDDQRRGASGRQYVRASLATFANVQHSRAKPMAPEKVVQLLNMNGDATRWRWVVSNEQHARHFVPPSGL